MTDTSTSRAVLKHSTYMTMATTLSRLSTCHRLKVGAVLLRPDGSVAGVGYNGALPGQPHCDEATCNPSSRCFRTRHAERSALDYSTGDIAAAYVTHEPCLRCTQDLIARGCRSVYYCEGYAIADVAEAAARAWHVYINGVAWRQMGEVDDRGTLGDITDELIGIGEGAIGTPLSNVRFSVDDKKPMFLRTPYGDIVAEVRRWAGHQRQPSDISVWDLDSIIGVRPGCYLPASIGIALLRTASKVPV